MQLGNLIIFLLLSGAVPQICINVMLKNILMYLNLFSPFLSLLSLPLSIYSPPSLPLLFLSQGFFTALRLVSACQCGREPSLKSIQAIDPPPKFVGVEQSAWAIDVSLISLSLSLSLSLSPSASYFVYPFTSLSFLFQYLISKGSNACHVQYMSVFPSRLLGIVGPTSYYSCPTSS